MSLSNGHNGDRREPGSGNLPPEFLIAKTLHQRLEKENILRQGDREEVAYRIAEIMVASKDLYTVSLQRLLGEGETLSFHEELAGMRMALLHLRDLVADFDSAFLDSMLHEREGQSVESAWLDPSNWEPEELGELGEDYPEEREE